MSMQDANAFEKLAPESPTGGLLGEFWAFVCHNKKWWLLPILVILFVFSLLLLLSGTAAAPFIYTLF